MSFSSGTFSINSTGQPVVTGTVISSTVFNAFTADLATGLSTCVLKDGTQTLTADIPMSSFKLTGLAAGTANGHSVRWQQTAPGILTTTGDTLYASAANTPARLGIGTARQQLATNSGATAPEWIASMQSILTTTGDTIQTTAANTPARLAATASVAAHATTSDVWTARETILTGTAVTFTDIADAPYVGAVAWVYQNAAHIWTDGAVFDVQGGANYTATIGDWVRINAVTVSTFDVTIFKADGTAVVPTTAATQAEQETATSLLVPVTPGRQQFHPSAVKSWVRFSSNGAIAGSYNTTSITDNGAGDWTWNITTAFSNANAVCAVATCGVGAAAPLAINVGAAPGTQTVQLQTRKTTDGVLADPTAPDIICASAFGDQ